jgi:hypothetical protein
MTNVVLVKKRAWLTPRLKSSGSLEMFFRRQHAELSSSPRSCWT